MKELTDYELIQKCINGEKQYFSEIVTRNKNLDKYFPDYKFSTWVVRITTNHVIDYIRKKKYETVAMEEVEYRLTFENTPENEYIEREERECLNTLLENLPEIYRVPLILYHKQGLSYQEIADVIKEPLSKVKNRIFRGRKILKEELLKMKEGEGFGLQQS